MSKKFYIGCGRRVSHPVVGAAMEGRRWTIDGFVEDGAGDLWQLPERAAVTKDSGGSPS
jgi:hypothetical protein